MPVGMTNMLTTACSKPCAKKMKIGMPGGGDLADRRGGRHRRDDGEADHPVAQHRLDEDGDHAGIAERRVADGFGFRDRDDFRRDARRRAVPKLVSAIASSAP